MSKTLGNPLRGHLGSSCAADPKSELLQVGEAIKVLNLGLARREKKIFSVLERVGALVGWDGGHGDGVMGMGMGLWAWGWGYGRGDGVLGVEMGCWVWK